MTHSYVIVTLSRHQWLQRYSWQRAPPCFNSIDVDSQHWHDYCENTLLPDPKPVAYYYLLKQNYCSFPSLKVKVSVSIMFLCEEESFFYSLSSVATGEGTSIYTLRYSTSNLSLINTLVTINSFFLTNPFLDVTKFDLICLLINNDSCVR